MESNAALAALYRDLVKTLSRAELQQDLDDLGHSAEARLERIGKYLRLTFLKHSAVLEEHLDPADLTVRAAADDADLAQLQLSYQVALQVQLRMPYSAARGTSPTLSVVGKLSELDEALLRMRLSR